MTSMTGRDEWRTMWPLALVSMLGLSGCAMFAFSSGVFMGEMTSAFGWSRAEFSAAFVLQMMLGLIILPSVGWLIDRFGPRRVALLGIVPFMACFSLLGLSSGSIWQWWIFCAILAVGQGLITQTIWVSAVVSRFHASRGLALAVVLCGLGVGTLIWPPLSAFYVENLGWRTAFPALAATWGVVMLPLTALFFYGATDSGPRVKKPAAQSYMGALKSGTFIGLMVAGGLFSAAYYGASVHLVPILQSKGMSLGTAAGIAGGIGIFSIIGRLGAGHLLDRLPTRAVGVAAFLLPVPGILLLMLAPTVTPPVAIAAVVLLGLAAGAEMDIITYIAAQRFGDEVFASIYSFFVAILAACASFGPLLGGALFDAGQSYQPFLLVLIPMVVAGALLIGWMQLKPAVKVHEPQHQPA